MAINSINNINDIYNSFCLENYTVKILDHIHNLCFERRSTSFMFQINLFQWGDYAQGDFSLFEKILLYREEVCDHDIGISRGQRNHMY